MRLTRKQRKRIMADTTQSFNQTWTAPTKVGGRYIQAPLVQQDTGFFRNITQNAPSLENNYNLSRSGDFYDIWSNPQPLGLLVEPGVNPQHSRNYAFENQDFPEVILDIQNAPATWGGSSVGTKIRNDLGNDPAIRSTLEQFPSKVLRGDQSWKNMVTTDEVDRLSSRLFGSGYFGNRLKEYARFDNRFLDSDPEDRAHFKEGSEGYFKKQDGTLMNPFDIMYYDEIKETDPISAIDSGVFDDQFTVNDRSVASTDPIEVLLQNNPGILDTTEQPINLGQTNADTLQSFFNIPEVTPVGTDSGTVIVEDTPEGTILTDNTPVFNTPIVDPSTWLPDDHIDTMPVLDPFAEEESTFPGTIEDLLGDRLDYNAPFNELLNVRPETTPEEFDDFVTSQILGVDIPEAVSSLPSGPEEMTEVFTEEDKAAEDERKRIEEIVAQAERDQFELERKAERLAWKARREQERAEEDARKKREEAAKAEDRQDKARLAREADERERQARERQRELENERRQAVEAARLNALAAAAKKQEAAAKKREEENKKKQEAESKRLHKLNMEMLDRMRRDREERARQQASMPKSWAFF